MGRSVIETRSTVFQVGDGLSVRFERARLLVQSGPDAGREYRLQERPVVIGRGEGCDLQLADTSVSRTHAAVKPHARGWRVEDLASKSGTWVDGTRVDAAPLASGNRIRLGESELEFRVGSAEVKAPPHPAGPFEGMLGESPAVRRLFGLIARMAALDLPVLLAGESGTGKERLARAVHALGPTPEGPYEVVDCTLLDRDHLRSELFGHVKGAFTGADSARTGALARAHGGTVFFDEVGELPLDLQPALLRVLQEGEVRPLGGDAPRQVRVRVVSATNRKLEEEVEAGRFREDLFYRLSALAVEVPPLRERAGDALLLAEHFLPPGTSLAPETRERLLAYPWPGNVRQLENTMRRAGALAQGGVVRPEDLGRLPEAGPVEAPPSPLETLDAALAEAETARIQEALREAGGNRKRAAAILGISRATLYRKLDKLGIE